MTDPFRYLQHIWLNRDKIYLASPENLPFLFVGTLILAVVFLLVWHSKLKGRLKETYASRYSVLMDLKFWLGMILAYSLAAYALSKPMIAKSSFKKTSGPVKVKFDVDVSLSSHSKYLGESGPTILETAKKQIQAIEPILADSDEASLYYFGRTAHEAHPMFPLDKSLRPLFIKAVQDIRMPERLRQISTYNPTLNFIDSSNIASVLGANYKHYDKTQKLRNPNYVPSREKNILIFLFSDGDFNLDQSGKSEDQLKRLAEYRKNIFAALDELKKRGIRIYAIGIGSRSGIPLADALKKYKKGDNYMEHDYNQAYENAIIKRGLSKVNPSDLKLLVEKTGGNPNSDVIILDGPKSDAYDFMRRAINSHRQEGQAVTVESRDDEPLWKTFVVPSAIAVIVLSLVGWKILLTCSLFFYFFGEPILSHVPIVEWLEKFYSFIAKSFA